MSLLCLCTDSIFDKFFFSGSIALDQICGQWMWREHNQRAVEGLCVEDIEQWEGNATFLWS